MDFPFRVMRTSKEKSVISREEKKSLIIKSNNYFLNISMADKQSKIEIESGAFSFINYIWFVSLEFLRTYSVLHLCNVVIITDIKTVISSSSCVSSEIKDGHLKSNCLFFSAWSLYFLLCSGKAHISVARCRCSALDSFRSMWGWSLNLIAFEPLEFPSWRTGFNFFGSLWIPNWLKLVANPVFYLTERS